MTAAADDRLVLTRCPKRQKGIHMGLTLYSLGKSAVYYIRLRPHVAHLHPGAIFFWPSAKFRSYGGFVGCTFVIGELHVFGIPALPP